MTRPERFTLRVNRTINASPARLFDAWTSADALLAWWGPSHVKCSDAAVDLRVGGRYHIDNELPDGRVVRIEGELEIIEPPHRLVYSWSVDGGESERVTVRFDAEGDATVVSIVHERIASKAARDDHEGGWIGCLDGLVDYVDDVDEADDADDADEADDADDASAGQ